MTHINKQLIPVTVSQIIQVTPKIKIFKLTHNKKGFTFSPGQWIDLYAPISGKNIGGYTIISNPHTPDYIELAIRESDHHPVTKFMHEKVIVGSLLHITEGQGRFFIPLDLESEMYKLPLVFIAGGIGVTPAVPGLLACQPDLKLIVL
ncbi:MAG: FAD-dependent oxidoreductase [Bacteriovoracaceae bacterium]|nr:FAD-dependent oxidoreductase [Bacteriovoracaceae bacterium]